MHNPIRWATLAVFSLAVAGAGSASADSKDKAAKKTDTTTSGAICPMDDTAKLKTVLTFLHTSNQNEIKHSKLAADHAQSPEVKQFAERMVREHTDADKRLTDLSQKKGIDLTPALPADPVHAAVMGADAKAEQSLSGKKGAAFDAAFLGPEAMEHDLTLAVIEEGQKVAKDDDVKRMLSDIHATVTQHKEHATNLIDKMKMGSAAVGGGPGSEQTEPGKTMPNKGKMMPNKSKGGTGGGPSTGGTKSGGTKSGGTKSDGTKGESPQPAPQPEGSGGSSGSGTGGGSDMNQ